MSKKDRVAIVITVLYLLLPITMFSFGGAMDVMGGIISFAPLILYWGFRFIKGDISFMRADD